MRFLSVCSGIEAASQAWHPLGWKAVAFSEIEPFPCAVLAHHYPDTPNWGDMTKYKDWPDVSIDLLCGGTPCQSFSVAGLRKGLDDPRGNLMLTFGAIAAKYRPQWLVWENVPGVLSSNGGRDFGSFLGLLGLLGYGFAYRVLDAQYFGVAQRRRRVFVVGCLGDWRSAAAVLFERHSLSGHPAPSRKAGKVAPTIPARSTAGGGLGTDFDCDGGLIPAPSQCITTGTGQRYDPETETILPVTHSLRGEGFDASEDGTGRDTPLVPVGVTIHGTDPTVQKVASYSEVAQCLRARTPGNIDNSSTTVVQQPVAYGIRTANTSSNGWGIQEECTHTPDCAQGVAVAQPVAFHPTQDPISSTDGSTHALGCGSTGGQASVAVAVALRGREGGATAELGDEVQNCLRASGGGGDKAHVLAPAYTTKLHNTTSNQAGKVYEEYTVGLDRNSPPPALLTAMQVRRLTPKECARLQGFPDDYLDITVRGKPAADSPKYKALGNSWAVPNVAWIGRRIDAVEEIKKSCVKVAA